MMIEPLRLCPDDELQQSQSRVLLRSHTGQEAGADVGIGIMVQLVFNTVGECSICDLRICASKLPFPV
jgi:hypothetical protein